MNKNLICIEFPWFIRNQDGFPDCVACIYSTQFKWFKFCCSILRNDEKQVEINFIKPTNHGMYLSKVKYFPREIRYAVT